MKKVLFLVLILIIGGVLYATRNSTPQLGFERPDDSETFQPDPSNGTFIFDDGPATLLDGKGEKEIDDTDLVEEITLLDKTGYGDVNGDNKDDAIVFLARYGGGSGTFIYVAAFVSGPVGYKGSNAVFLGDRISPQDISISNGIVTVKYLDRSEDEAFSAEPTIPVSRQFVLRNGVFEER